MWAIKTWCVLVGVIFGVAVVAKTLDPSAFLSLIQFLGLNASLAKASLYLLLGLETVLVVMLICRAGLFWSKVTAGVLCAFTLGLVVIRIRFPDAPSCGCFARTFATISSNQWSDLVRNVGILGFWIVCYGIDRFAVTKFLRRGTI